MHLHNHTKSKQPRPNRSKRNLLAETNPFKSLAAQDLGSNDRLQLRKISLNRIKINDMNERSVGLQSPLLPSPIKTQEQTESNIKPSQSMFLPLGIWQAQHPKEMPAQTDEEVTFEKEKPRVAKRSKVICKKSEDTSSLRSKGSGTIKISMLGKPIIKSRRSRAVKKVMQDQIIIKEENKSSETDTPN